jgi:hypothetical protein
VEELELYPAPLEHFVKRGEDRVAHPGLHLPHERPFVSQEQAHVGAEGHAGRDIWRGQVTALISEQGVVQAGGQGRVQGAPAVVHQVFAQPGPVLQIVDRVEAALQNFVFDDAAQTAVGEVQRQPQAAVGGVRVNLVFDDLPEEDHEEFQKVGDDVESGLGQACLEPLGHEVEVFLKPVGYPGFVPV